MSKYVDVDVLTRKLDNWYKDLVGIYGQDEDYVKGYSDAINDIADVPEAGVQEVKHAKWLTDRFGMERAICSICGAVYEGGDGFRFCPKCGAKMDLEETNG